MTKLVAILPLIALGLLGAWEIRDYELVHKPLAAKMLKQFEYAECVRNCQDDQRALCERLGIKPEDCEIDCSRCRSYLEKEGD